MSDFLVSEILVLVLLLPPLLRPFSKSLQKAVAVPILPLFSAAISVLVIWGHGLTVSFVPILFMVAVSIITEFIRFVLFLGKLPNNFYSIPSILLRIFLLTLVIGLFCGVFYFSPEQEYKTGNVQILKEPLTAVKNGRETQTGFCYTPQTKINGKVLVINAFLNSTGTPSTVSLYLAGKGYTVMELIPFVKSEKKMFIKRGEAFFTALHSIFKNETLSAQADRGEFYEVLSALTEKERPFYVFAEGPYTKFLADYTAKHPAAFEGVFYAVSEDNMLLTQPELKNAYILDERKDIRFSQNIKSYPSCVFIRKKEVFAGWGELRCEDILAAMLLGATRDLGRRDRIFTGETVEKWLELK